MMHLNTPTLDLYRPSPTVSTDIQPHDQHYPTPRCTADDPVAQTPQEQDAEPEKRQAADNPAAKPRIHLKAVLAKAGGEDRSKYQDKRAEEREPRHGHLVREMSRAVENREEKMEADRGGKKYGDQRSGLQCEGSSRFTHRR